MKQIIAAIGVSMLPPLSAETASASKAGERFCASYRIFMRILSCRATRLPTTAAIFQAFQFEIAEFDRNFRAQHEGKVEWAKEVERMKLIHMPDPDDRLFVFRTMAERVNARLKDEFGARSVRVRGAIKVKCHLMFGVVALAVDQILRVTQLRPAPA
jgi:hypothetical protein